MHPLESTHSTSNFDFSGRMTQYSWDAGQRLQDSTPSQPPDHQSKQQIHLQTILFFTSVFNKLPKIFNT